jgi:hypothetical protein
LARSTAFDPPNTRPKSQSAILSKTLPLSFAARRPAIRIRHSPALTKRAHDLEKLPDQLQDHLRLVFAGTAAGQRSADVGHYYAHPGNRFWRSG